VNTIFTDREVALILQINVKQAQALFRRGPTAGGLDGFKVGDKWRITEPNLRAYIGEGQGEPQATEPAATVRSIRRRARAS
jgi:hypothetical protein